MRWSLRNNRPFISVIIPTYNDWTCLQDCISALDEQSLAKNDFEIIVVNNDPAGRIPECFKFPINFRLISELQPGSYSARNSGILAAVGDIIVFTDSDCVPDKDWLYQIMSAFQSDMAVTRVAGSISLTFKSTRRTWLSAMKKLLLSVKKTTPRKEFR
ncbi:glycosyltransferase family 2 protein [Halomonas sp. BC04]|uniref:glycosyltransferase family 2 protein n=1 Tax=Halomonas sp. BC04 TaxID=1403540 RepID=UPI003FA587CE